MFLVWEWEPLRCKHFNLFKYIASLDPANGYLLGKVRVALKNLGSHVTRKGRRETRCIKAAGEINEASRQITRLSNIKTTVG